MTRALPIAERLRAFSVVGEDGCWTWQRAKNSRGYSLVSIDGKVLLGHRVSYETFVGPIPDGLSIDHLCRNKLCVNPEHLEPVTSRENTHRRPDVHKTHCSRGHELTEENTILKPRANGWVIRNCRTCEKARRRVAYVKANLVAPVLPLPVVAEIEQAAS